MTWEDALEAANTLADTLLGTRHSDPIPVKLPDGYTQQDINRLMYVFVHREHYIRQEHNA